jgi:tetratricopeptide (TPR) repeat protein
VLAEEIGNSYQKLRALIGMATVYREQGRYPLAVDTYRDALVIARGMGDQRNQAHIYDGLAQTFHSLGRRDAGRIHWRLALQLFNHLGMTEAAQDARIKIDALADPDA